MTWRYFAFTLLILLSGCISNTHVSYFPDQRGPFYCRLTESSGSDSGTSENYEVEAIQDWRDAFVLRKASTDEFIVLANNMRVISATANPIYEYQWGIKHLAAVKLVIIVGIESDQNILQAVEKELKKKYPDGTFTESKAKDIVVDIYSIWLGSEYTRAPCDGVALDNIPFEMTLPGDDGAKFLMADGQSMQIAGRVLYQDAKSGWRFHRSFSLQRRDFILAN